VSSNPQVSQSSVPAAGEGSNIQDVNSPKFQKRMDIAQYLQDELDQELAKRVEIAKDPRFVNKNITMKHLDINFRKKNLTLPSVKDDFEKDIIQYYLDYPQAFHKHGKQNAPGNTLISDLINHLRNNRD
jgi:hypothetical protein